jgi:hypothetical protein
MAPTPAALLLAAVHAVAVPAAAPAAATPVAGAPAPAVVAPPAPGAYEAVVEAVASMVSDPAARQAAERRGMRILNVLWEDTGRWEGSALGPNISDVTLEVRTADARGRRLALVPVLRFPNFSDRTADVRLDRIWLRVGNEREGAPEAVVTLREFLADPARWLSRPGDGRIAGGSLLAPRDTHALVSAQAAFLPVPREGRATFHPVLFNYQSWSGNPAVLTLLVTRQGTSVTVVDNARDTVPGGGSRGQRLFFNAAGRRAPLTAERLSDVLERGTTANGEAAASLGEDANLLLLVQVPLRQHERARRAALAAEAAPAAKAGTPAPAPADLEAAVLGHGEAEGPFTELAGLALERDPRFPVRVTVQFYQAVSSPRIGDREVEALAGLVSRVYERGDEVGSLVVPGPGGGARPTRWDGAGPAPAVSWGSFPGLAELRCRPGGGAGVPGIGVR